MRPLVLVLFLITSFGCASHATSHHRVDKAQVRAQITEMMHQSAKAWTANDLDGFMAGFHNDEDLRFATPGGITLGWENVKARYANSIAKSDLRFSDLDITVLTPDAAVVFGRFHNDGKDGSYGTGLYTLLVRKIDGNWVIVHDHSSDLPPDGP